MKKKENKSIRAIIENVNGKMLAIASDESEDRQGDELSADKWDLKNFKANPVLQFAHDYSIPPVGIAKNLRIEDKKLIFEPEFHEITQLAREVKQLYAEGIMKAFSVGFINGKDSMELLEISAVPVPANPRALVLEKSMKEYKNEEREKVVKWVTKEAKGVYAEDDDDDIADVKIWDETDNEIRFQIIDPEECEPESFRTVELKKDKPKIMAVMAKIMNEDDMKIQSLRFPKDEGWTIEMAKDWVNTHPDIKLEDEKPKEEAASIDDKLVEQKIGRVLSKKNRDVLEIAMQALAEVLKADEREDADAGKSIDVEKEEMEEIEEKTLETKNIKGRGQPLNVRKTVEAINSQLGYLIRKSMKK